MKALLVLIAIFCISVVFSATTVSFNGNATVSNAVDFKYRSTSAFAYPFYNWATYFSLDVTYSQSGNQASGEADAILGMVKFPTNTFIANPNKKGIPLSFLAKANVKGQIAYSDVNAVANYQLDAQASLIISALKEIQERKPDGTVVRTLELKNLNYDLTGQNTNPRYVNFAAVNPPFGTYLKANEKLEFIFIISDVLGKVTIDGLDMIVSPKCLESVIYVGGWQYVDTANHLVLVTGVATGKYNGHSYGSAAFIGTGDGKNQVYASYSDVASYSGTISSVTVNRKASADINIFVDDANVTVSLQAVYQANVYAEVVEIAFKPGATKIVYDPTIGVGEPYNSATTMLFCALFLSIIVLLF